MSYQTENSKLLESFFERTFFRSWQQKPRKQDNWSGIELQLTATCNLGCRYCYLDQHGMELYPHEMRHADSVLHNLQMVLNWLASNGYSPCSIDVFSGEPFAQRLGFDAFRLMAEHYADVSPELRPESVVVPTNYTFLLDGGATDEVEDLLNRFDRIGIRLALSASVDGKFQQTNRPFHGCTAPDPRDDEYYEKLFAFNAKHCFGFHPMIYSHGIEQWPENFLWFMDGFRRYSIHPSSLYLLDVRNAEWSSQQARSFSEFMRFLIHWVWDFAGHEPGEFWRFINEQHGFNILSAPFSRVGRGLGCGLQSMMYVRLGDLSIVPCHRTMYPGMEGGRFVVEQGEIAGIEAVNPEFLLAVLTLDGSSLPMCERCLIEPMCGKGCIGAQYEATGDFFSPIPTVCQLEHAKLAGMVRGYKEIGLCDELLGQVSRDMARRLETIMRWL